MDDIPVVHNTVEYILSTYGVIKDVNPLVKSSLERSEDVAYWLKEKAENVVTATHLDEPLKKLDTAAANGVIQVEKTSSNVSSLQRNTSNTLKQTKMQLRHRIAETNKDMHARIKDSGFRIRKRTEDARYTLFEGIQTLLDYIEDRFESVMLKPSPEAEKYSTEPSMMMSMGRMVDITYRLNLGIIYFTAEKAKALVDPKAWVRIT